jgi:hypothetical protein
MVDVLTGLNSDVTGTLSTIGLLNITIVINMSTTTGDRNATGSRKITTSITKVVVDLKAANVQLECNNPCRAFELEGVAKL